MVNGSSGKPGPHNNQLADTVKVRLCPYHDSTDPEHGNEWRSRAVYDPSRSTRDQSFFQLVEKVADICTAPNRTTPLDTGEGSRDSGDTMEKIAIGDRKVGLVCTQSLQLIKHPPDDVPLAKEVKRHENADQPPGEDAWDASPKRCNRITKSNTAVSGRSTGEKSRRPPTTERMGRFPAWLAAPWMTTD